MTNLPDNPQDAAREVPMEDYGGDSPQRRPPPGEAPPDLRAQPESATDEARDAVLENAPVEDYGGNSRDTRPHPTG